MSLTFATSPMTVKACKPCRSRHGAFTRAIDQVGVSAFTSTFRWDAQTLAVVATNPPFPNGVFTLFGPFTYDVTFNEAVDPTTVQMTDLTLSGVSATVTNVTVLPGNMTARFTITTSGLEGTLTVNIAANAFTDFFGNFGSAAFSATYQVDNSTTELQPTDRRDPLGSLVRVSSDTGIYNFGGDSDGFKLNIVAGQTIAVFVDPTGSVQPTIELRDPSGTVIGTATASAVGQNALLQAVATTTSGFYTPLSSAWGQQHDRSFALEVTVNASLELEEPHHQPNQQYHRDGPGYQRLVHRPEHAVSQPPGGPCRGATAATMTFTPSSLPKVSWSRWAWR